MVASFLPRAECDKYARFMLQHLDVDMIQLQNGTYSRLKKKEVVLAKNLTGLLQQAAARDEGLQRWLGRRWREAYVNPFFFWTGYSRGGHIDDHVDGNTRNAEGASIATVLVYINDGYTGGETVFTGPPQQTVVPRAGNALLLRQDVVHHAQPVQNGRKLLLRTDVMLPHPNK